MARWALTESCSIWSVQQSSTDKNLNLICPKKNSVFLEIQDRDDESLQKLSASFKTALTKRHKLGYTVCDLFKSALTKEQN